MRLPVLVNEVLLQSTLDSSDIAICLAWPGSLYETASVDVDRVFPPNDC